jgi:cytochrome c-type biogenesis protein CcmH/NrfG
MENKEIKLNIQLTEKDYMDFQWSHFSLFRTKKWISFSVFLDVLYGILYAPYILKVGFTRIDISIFWPLLMFPVGLICMYFLLKYRTKVAFKTDSFINKPQKITVNEEGIYVEAYRSNINPLWTDIYKYNDTKQGVYIYIADLKAMIIPIRFLNENDKMVLLEFLKTKVNTEKHITQSKKSVRIRTALYAAMLIGIFFYSFKNYNSNKLEDKAYELQENHNFAEAERTYTALINMNPEDESNYIERACCKISLNKINSAVLDCETALKLNPNNGRAYYIYAYALINDGRQPEACKAINKSIQLGYATTTEKICGE